MKRLPVTPGRIRRFGDLLITCERSSATAEKYTRDVAKLMRYAGDKPLSKELLLGFKEALIADYAPASVNSMIAAVNSYLDYARTPALKLRSVRVQRSFENERELSRDEYFRLVETAEELGDRRSSLVFQTICSTGIRVSELRCVTAEAVLKGRAEIRCKGKHRSVYLPDSLCVMLRGYIAERGTLSGPVFVTSGGNPLDRSNVYKTMQRLGGRAGIPKEKLFPHNLRHLFARTYYAAQKDIARLADILGHSDVSTTRVYIKERGETFARQINGLDLTLDKKNTT